MQAPHAPWSQPFFVPVRSSASRSASRSVTRLSHRNLAAPASSTASAGSPLVLMRSGIGPEPHLRELGVDVIVDHPEVGHNLQDHAAATVVYRSARPIPPAANNHR